MSYIGQMQDSPDGHVINPFVTYLSALSTGKSHVLELGAKDFTIQTNSLRALSLKIQSDTPGLIVLTGNAGHGKTHLCAAAICESNPHIDWQQACALVQEFGRASAALPLGSRQFEVRLVKDLTELSIEDAKGLLSESVAHINDRLTIVCANEGRLRAVTESPTSSEYKNLVRLHDVLIRSLESHDSKIDEIQVFNLNLQKITAHPDTEQGSILSQLLTAWTADENWAACKACDKFECCPIRLNGSLMNEASPVTVLPFIQNSVRLAELLGYQFTIRQALVALAVAITNGNKCSVVHESDLLQNNGDLRSDSIFETLFSSAVDHPFNILLRAFQALDPGLTSSNQVDTRIDLVEIEDQMGQFWSDLSDLVQDEKWEPSVNDWRFLRRFLVMSRSEFSNSPSSLGSSLNIEYLSEFNSLIEKTEDDPRKLLLQMFRGLEAIQGIRSDDLGSTRLSIADQSFSDPSLGLDGIATKNTRRDPEGTRLLSSRIRVGDFNVEVEQVPPGENGINNVNHFSTRVYLRPQRAPLRKRMSIDYVDFLYLLSASKGLNASQFFAGQSLRLLRVLDSWTDEEPLSTITLLSKGKPVDFEWNGYRMEVDNG